MKEGEQMKKIVLGFIMGALLTTSIAYAADSNFVLSLFEAKLVFNGVEKQASDKPYQYYNGTSYVPTSLIYNGTTYVPLRFFSESSGQEVKYVGKDKTIFIGKVPEDGKIETSMSDLLSPFFKKGSYYSLEVNKSMKMAGKEYLKGYSIGRYSTLKSNDLQLSFNLEGKYTKITGLIGLDDSNNLSDSDIKFLVDDKPLTTITLAAGSMPQTFNLDVTGAIKLDIVVPDGNSSINLANVMIK